MKNKGKWDLRKCSNYCIKMSCTYNWKLLKGCVIGFGEISPLWLNVENFWQFFKTFFRLWPDFEPNYATQWLANYWLPVWAGALVGLVVMGGHGFESQCRILDGHFLTLICCQIVLMFVWKRPEINEKEAGLAHFFKKEVCLISFNFLILYWQHSQLIHVLCHGALY